MARILKSRKTIFYHVPKTGGVWVKEAMMRGGLRYDRCANKPGTRTHPFRLTRHHSAPGTVLDEWREGCFEFCFVRHPMGWYQSFWAYRIKHGWLDHYFPADRYWDDLFDIFVDNMTEAYPEGFVTQLYQYFVDEVGFVGRQESLVDDLVTALKMAGEEFDEAAVRRCGLRNVSSGLPQIEPLLLVSPGTEARMLEAERWVLERFYGE